MKATSRFLVLAMSVILIFSGCSSEDNEMFFTFTFSHYIGSDAVEFNDIKYTNSAGDYYSIETLRYFVSDFTLHKSDGSRVFIDKVHYVDAEDISTMSFMHNEAIENGNFSRISFVFGMNYMQNMDGMFPNPPENAMEWPSPMGGGYHYMKLEGKCNSSGVINNYQAHTGQTMGHPYYINVDLANSGFTATDDHITVNIVMDVNNWWDTPHTINLNTVSGIMSNHTMQQQLMENGSNVFSVASIQ